MVDLAGWRPRLDELTRRHQVPGASLAVLAGGEVATLATGVLHKGTGVEVTTDSLFQIGSMTKAYTATVVLALVDQGLAGVDTPVAELLPGFRVADPEVSRRVTLRHLLCHTSRPAPGWSRATRWAPPSPTATPGTSSSAGSSNS